MPGERSLACGRVTSEEVLRLVVMPDEQGRYHFDEMGYETLASIPGLSRRLPGWAACRLAKQNITAIAWPNKNMFVTAYQQRMMRDRNASCPSLKRVFDE